MCEPLKIDVSNLPSGDSLTCFSITQLRIFYSHLNEYDQFVMHTCGFIVLVKVKSGAYSKSCAWLQFLSLPLTMNNSD